MMATESRYQMASTNLEWTLLVYKIPPQPTRLRLQIWRRLQRMGALYLQDAVCVLPARADLQENMQYIGETITEMDGTYHLFTAKCIFADGGERIVDSFRQLADMRYEEIAARTRIVEASLEAAVSLTALEGAEEDLKRERIAYLKAKRLAYFGSDRENEVERRLDTLRSSLDDIHRGSGK